MTGRITALALGCLFLLIHLARTPACQAWMLAAGSQP